MKRILSVISLAATLLASVACGDILGVIEEFGGDPSKVSEISITPSSVTIKAEGGEANIAFTAPAVWSASSSAGWLTIEPAAGTSGEVVVKVIAEPNPDASSRTATVKVESGNLTASAIVIQEGIGGSTQPGDSTAAEKWWYICGDFTDNWNSDSALRMDYEGDGVYTLDLDIEPRAEFKFIMDKNWGVNLGADTFATVKAGEPFTLRNGGFNIVFNPGGHINVKLDVFHYSCLITGGNEPTDPVGQDKWYIVVGANNVLDINQAIEMEDLGSNVWKTTATLPEGAEFKFVKNASWSINLGATEWAADNHSPAIASGETVNLVSNGYNVYYPQGGEVTITVDLANYTMVLEDPNSTQVEAQWSIIGTINGTDWDTDFDMTKDGDVWKTTVYYRDGQEFKLRNNHDWSETRCYGMVDPRHMVVEAEPEGNAISLPYSAYWDVVYDPEKETLSFAPSEDVQWQYFLNPSGEPAWIEFTQSFWDETAFGYIKYYEVDGIRTCKTETVKHLYNGEYYEANGFWGLASAPGEGEWTFIWYTDNNLVQLAPQFTGYHHNDYDADLWAYDMYAYYKYVLNYPDLRTWLDEATASDTQFVSGYYDNNGGFYLNVYRYHMEGVGGYKIEADDIICEAEGYDRHDYSGSVDIGSPVEGVRDITFTVGRDIASVRYVIYDEQIADDDSAVAIAEQLINGSIDYKSIDQFTQGNGNDLYSVVKYSTDVPGYHTLVCVGLDSNGGCWFWYYWWFYLEPYVDPATLTWKSLGTGQYTDDFLTTFFETGNLTWDVEVEQCNEDPSRLRLVYPYDVKYAQNEEGDWRTDRSYDLEIIVRDNNQVYILPQEIGVDWGYGIISVASYNGYYFKRGYGYDELDPALYGSLVDGVITFPAQGLLVAMPNYNNGAWYYANHNGAFKLVLPGAVTGGADGAGVAAVAKKSVKPATGVLRMNERAGGNGKQLKPAAKKLAINRYSPVM